MTAARDDGFGWMDEGGRIVDRRRGLLILDDCGWRFLTICSTGADN
jgi:hypothetical protein